MMEPCPIIKSVCTLHPGGCNARTCWGCPDLIRFLDDTFVQDAILSKKDYLIPWLEDEAYKNAPERSFLERCYKMVIKDLEEVL